MSEVKRSTYRKLSINNYDFAMDGYLQDNLDIFLTEAIPYNWDGLFLVGGIEGAGKSTFASQIALYLDPKFNLDKVVYQPKEFLELIDNCEEESCILWDESITGAISTQWANQVSQAIISKLTQIRKKKLKLILCFPYLDMLNRYFVSRCLCSIYVYAKSFKDRGYGYFYTKEQTQYLYAYMKESCRLNPRKAYANCHKSFFFRFGKTFCLDEKEYDKKKEKNRLNELQKTDLWKDRFVKSLQFNKEKKQLSELAKYLKVKPPYFSYLLKELIN